jgi:hypothetical protein
MIIAKNIQTKCNLSLYIELSDSENLITNSLRENKFIVL